MKKYAGKKFVAKTCAGMAIIGLLMTGCDSKRGKDETTAADATTEAATDSSQEETTAYVPADPNDFVVDLDSINVSEYIDLSKVNDLEIKTSEVTASDAYIQYSIASSLVNTYGFTLSEKTEGTAAAGDTVTIDYKGYMNDIPFSGGTDTDAEVIIGSSKFIPGFEEGIIGKKVDDEFDIRLSFPEDYDEKDYAGKAAVFKVTLKKIQSVGEVTDEAIKEKTSGKFTTYKEFVEKTTEEAKKNYHNSVILGKILAVVEEKKQNEALINEYVQEQFYKIDADCARYGVDRLTYFNAIGIAVDELELMLKENGISYAKQKLTILGICREKGFEIKDGEMAEFKKKLIDEYDTLTSEEDLAKIMTEDELEYQLYFEKFIEYLNDYKTVD